MNDFYIINVSISSPYEPGLRTGKITIDSSTVELLLINDQFSEIKLRQEFFRLVKDMLKKCSLKKESI